jgi:two-component system, OmpR family, response regulator RegX3
VFVGKQIHMQSPTFRVLVAIANEEAASHLVAAFEREGDDVHRASTALDAKSLLSKQFDVALVGFDLPDVPPLEFCREITEGHRLPVVLVGQCHKVISIASGLDAGAIDMLALPIRTDEALCRVRGRLLAPKTDSVPTALRSSELVSGDIRIDQMRRRVWVAAREIRLRAKEFDLLAFLMTSPGVTFTRGDLMRRVWDTEWWSSTKTIDVHVGALRRHLGETAADESRVVAVRGSGYKFLPRYDD